MPTKLVKTRCPKCGGSVFKATMRPFQQVLHCVECFVELTLKKSNQHAIQRDRQLQRMKMKESQMPIKYGTAEHVKVTEDGKAVISDEPISTLEAEKVASESTKKKKPDNRKVTVTDKDFKRTDEDHIPGD